MTPSKDVVGHVDVLTLRELGGAECYHSSFCNGPMVYAPIAIRET